MGGRGTDVAREAAGLVLLDDNFISIVEAVRQGRRIYDNLTKAMAYVLAIHVPIAGMALLPIILKWPLVLLPVQIVFLELIIDPACSIVFEAEHAEKDIMSRKPRKLSQPLFNLKIVAISLLQGLSILAVTLLAYEMALKSSSGASEARAIAFVALVAANISLILTNRSWTKSLLSFVGARNTALKIMVLAVPLIMAAILFVPKLSRLFQFSRPHLMDVVGALAAGLLSVLWFEIYKLVMHYRQKRASAKEQNA
jgi:Ca2+-transporting ATPase